MLGLMKSLSRSSGIIGVRALRLSFLVALSAACSDPSPGVRVESVTIAASKTVLLLGPGGGESVQLTAIARDGRGEDLTDRRVAWSLAGSGIVNISPTGLVTAVGLGSISVRAEVEKISASQTITVIPVPVATLDLPNGPVAVVRSPVQVDRVQLIPTLRDSTGAVLGPRPVVWTSRMPSIVSVDGDGFVTPLAAGLATVVASLDGRSDSIQVTATVENRLPGAADMSIVRARWTQGAQNTDGTIPMLRGGRAAVVNVVVQSPIDLAVPAEFVLRLFTSSGALAWTDTLRVPISAGTSTDEVPTAQFLVPASRLLPGTRWEVVRDPRGLLQDASSANDRFPSGSAGPLSLITPPLLRLRFVPITLTAHGNATGNVSAANLAEYLRLVRQFGPVGDIEATIAPPFATSTSFGVAPTGGAGAFWVSLIQQLDAARVASPTDADAYWVAVVAPPAGFNSVTFGGWAFIPTNGASFGPGTRTLSLVNVGWFSRESQSRELVLHELGHTFGRMHAPCGGAGGPDPSYPISGGTIGGGGHDTWSFEIGATSRALPIELSRGDIMGYCTPTWISAYSYGAMAAFRGSVDAAIQVAPTRSRVVLVQANATDSAIQLERPRVMIGVPSEPEPSGAFTIEGYAADGALLFQHRVREGRWDHLDTVQPVSAAVPITAEMAAALATVTVRGPRGQHASAALRASEP